MKKALVIVYSVFSFISFAAIVFFTGYLVFKSYEKNSQLKEREFPAFKNQVVEWFAEAKSLKSELFRAKAEQAITDDSQLIGLYLYSKKDGVQFFGEKRLFGSGSYLKNEIDDIPGVNSSAWLGKPEYTGLPIWAVTFTLRLMETSGGEIMMDAIYWPFDFKDISQPIKWGFFILFVWLILSIIVRLFISTKSMREIYEMETDSGMSVKPAPRTPTPAVPHEPPRVTGESFRQPAEEPEEIKTEDKGEGFQEVKRSSAIGLFSPNTGLGWQDLLEDRLKFEINRTASSNQDMVFAFVSIDDFARLDDSFTIYKAIAKIVLNTFPFQDLAFEYGKDGYALILPDTDIQQGIKSLDQFRKKIAKTDFVSSHPTVSIGLSSRNGRLLSEKTLIQEAEMALSKAKQEGAQRIFAFKADADKYRKVIAEKF